MEDLQRVYELLNKEIAKAKHYIEWIDKIIETCERLSVEYWLNVRAEKVAFLDGLSKAADIVFKELQGGNDENRQGIYYSLRRIYNHIRAHTPLDKIQEINA